MATVSFRSVDPECVEGFTVGTLANPTYLPQNAHNNFLHPGRVTETIRNETGLQKSPELEALVEYSRQNPWVFLTLAVTKLIKKMPLLLSGDFADSHLPVRMEHDKKTRLKKIYSVADRQNRPWECFADGEDNMTWDWTELDLFVSKQWMFFAVFFEDTRFEYEIHHERPLPYVSLTDEAAAGGHFGKVFKVGLLPEYLGPHITSSLGRYLPQVSHDSRLIHEVAVKQLNLEGATEKEISHFFDKETDTLKIMKKLKHAHLIEAISAYRKGPNRYFVFPWAPGGNLRDLWNGDSGSTQQQVRLWAWDQIRGLTDGLNRLHATNTRHGDLKPENILIFGGGGNSKLGPLVIADVGIAKFHAVETRKRQVQGFVTTNKNGTLRYEPPEIELYKPQNISRRYDSWSLGCVLLEFVIWLLRGSAGQAQFYKERTAWPNHDRFWEQDRNRKPILNPVVERWINQELSGDLAAAPALGDLMKLVASHLLVAPLDKRASVHQFYESLKDIHKKCSADPLYLWNGPDIILTRRKDSAAEEANDFVVPISQQRTSTLVDKWETVTDPGLVSELLEGLKWSQWPGTRSLAASPSRLCRDCTVIDFTFQSYELQRTLQDLLESAAECALCGFLYRRISALTEKPQEPLRLGRIHSMIKVYPVDQPIMLLYCDPSPELPFAQLGIPRLPEAGSREQSAFLKSLIRKCDATHDCMPAQKHSDSPAKLPTRLIDVGRDDAEPIRLVQTTQESAVKGPYIALSHCWGALSPEQRFCTYKDNLAQWKAHIAYGALPQSFQDAVRTTRALGVRYLWIDSLCIVQDDPDDWSAEAGRMEDVFSHAYCTIAASSAVSSLNGFLGHRRHRDVIKLSAPGGEPFYLAEDIDDFRTDVENSILSSRGWVLQERALSRRTIYFTSSQVYWECGNGVVCETLTQLQNPQSRFLGDSNFPAFGLQFYKDERIRLVQHFYTAYSALALSHTSDRAQAVAGLQRRIARAFGSAADHGVLWRWPERMLLWRRAADALTRIDYDHSAAPPPSWSWMAYDGRITFLDIPFADVEWMGNVHKPSGSEGDGRVQAVASWLRVDGAELMERAVLDVQGVENVEESWRCVLLGKNRTGEDEDDAAHYVLLIRPIVSSSGQPDDLYERVGVATLLASHLSAETSSVLIV
ncbi:hypothetical protein VMCG_10306 [Cytospora schulzeri]|uniref:Protein kinase domain-containing protein n=1 Tax=Cytospora schulzeri TaxID=448051 RepID=A0A423VCU4_9PEZI|nr:hypothetical protein VMCG_10306 [Valsa malicola]